MLNPLSLDAFPPPVTGLLEPCTAQLCPYADAKPDGKGGTQLINRVIYGELGESRLIRGHSWAAG